MQRSTSRWRTIAVLLAAGVASRVLLYHLRPPVSGDALVYGDIASNVLHFKTYALTVDGVVKPTLIRLPGYPLFLALCFAIFGTGNYVPAVVLQVVLDLSACCLLGLLASRLMGPRAGLWTLALAALCPFTANYSVVPLTESLNVFCVVMAFFSFERWHVARSKGAWTNRWLAALTASITLAALLRPDRALLGVVLFSALAWIAVTADSASTTKRLQPLLLTVLGVGLVFSLWAARNWRTFHVFQPLAPKNANDPEDEVALGFMRWYRTWGISYKNTVEVYWTYDGSVVNFNDVPPRAFDSPAQREETQKLFAKYNEETGSTPPIDAEFAALAEQRIAAHPLRYRVGLPLARLADMWMQPRTELLRMPLDWWRWKRHPSATILSLFYVLLNATYLLLAALGIVKWKRSRYSGQAALAWAMFAFVLTRSALLATLDNAEQRYTVDCLPVVLLLAGLAFAKTKINAECDWPSC